MSQSPLKRIRKTLGGETTLDGVIEAMGKEREEQVMARLSEFSEQVVVIVRKLLEVVKGFASDRYEELETAAKEMDVLESEADGTKEAILDRLALGGVFPMNSADLARLVSSVDSIANLAAGAADRLAMRRFSLPQRMNDLLLSLAQVDMEAIEALSRAVVSMGDDLREALRIATTVGKMESRADDVFTELYHEMFAWDTDYKTFHQLKAIIERLESIADRCSQNSHLIRHIVLEHIDSE